MAKRNRTKPTSSSAAGTSGEVGPRQPCPCGSGKRYKACHGSASGEVYVARPFAGLPGECDYVALRELVPAATAPLTLRDGRSVQLCSLLPGAAPAMRRDSGEIWLGLQVQHNYGDPSRDLAAVLERALAADEPGVIGLPSAPGAGPRLQDLVTDDPLVVTVHDGFGYWIADVPEDPNLTAALEQADAGVHPTAKLAGVPAAYWTNVGIKEHLRWVLPDPEGEVLDGLARLHAAGRDHLIEGGRFVGMFRAHGLVVPVWDLPLGTGPEAIEDAVGEFAGAFAEARTDVADLTPAERSAKAGLANRQVTLR